MVYEERGHTRSGRQFAQGNVGHFTSVAQLRAHHWRLLELETTLNQRLFEVGADQGWLIQATLRYSIRNERIRTSLLERFVRLFREHNEGRESGFEVLVTFNAILSNADGTSFSVFYGHDYRAGNFGGGAPELRYRSTYLVRTVGDAARIPVDFNYEELAEAHRHMFEKSGVHIHSFLNIVYLVYRYVPIARRLPPSIQKLQRYASRNGPSRQTARGRPRR